MTLTLLILNSHSDFGSHSTRSTIVNYLSTGTPLTHYAARGHNILLQLQRQRSRGALPLPTAFFSLGTSQQPSIFPEELLFAAAIVKSRYGLQSAPTFTPSSESTTVLIIMQMVAMIDTTSHCALKPRPHRPQMNFRDTTFSDHS